MTEAELIHIIESDQNNDGSFSHVSSISADFSDAQTYTTTFFTSLILESLCDARHTRYADICDKAATLLKNELNQNETLNYWLRNSTEAKIKPYPDDLDDTMLGLHALYLYDPVFFNAQKMMAIITLLTLLETNPGGPYKTWLTDLPDPAWHDVDVAVNANVATFLTATKIKNSCLAHYIKQKIAGQEFVSPYYPTIFPILYYLSRASIAGTRTQLQNIISQHTDQNNTLQDFALLALSLMHLNAPIHKIEPLVTKIATAHIATVQAYPFCFDPEIKGTPRFAGCRALTAALCLSALVRFEEIKIEHSQNQMQRTIENRILKIVKSHCDIILFNELKKLHRDYKSHRIIFMAHDFAQALKDPPKITSNLLDMLGAANLFGWYAYTIFDAIIDEGADTNKLPRALHTHDICVRLFSDAFADHPDFIDYVADTLAATHKALRYEVDHLRFNPDSGIPTTLNVPFPYAILAQRSFGHVLGPLGLFYLQTSSTEDPDFQNLADFYHHFLIARQLLDDAHDWEEDLKKGQLNAVSYDMLININIKVNINTYFWEKYFPTLLDKTEEQLDLCSRSTIKLSNFVKPTYFEKLLMPIQKQITKSHFHYEQTKQLMTIHKNEVPFS